MRTAHSSTGLRSGSSRQRILRRGSLRQLRSLYLEDDELRRFLAEDTLSPAEMLETFARVVSPADTPTNRGLSGADQSDQGLASARVYLRCGDESTLSWEGCTEIARELIDDACASADSSLPPEDLLADASKLAAGRTHGMNAFDVCSIIVPADTGMTNARHQRTRYNQHACRSTRSRSS
jgi:hypothetical protein